MMTPDESRGLDGDVSQANGCNYRGTACVPPLGAKGEGVIRWLARPVANFGSGSKRDGQVARNRVSVWLFWAADDGG